MEESSKNLNKFALQLQPKMAHNRKHPQQPMDWSGWCLPMKLSQPDKSAQTVRE